MKYKIISAKPFKAIINLGLQKLYSDQLFTKQEVISYLQAYQKKQLDKEGLSLSVAVKEMEIVMADQVEPHLELSIINYPKFPLEPDQLKNQIENLAKSLMKKFDQNRIVIEFLDETLMLEMDKKLDPRVNRYITKK